MHEDSVNNSNDEAEKRAKQQIEMNERREQFQAEEAKKHKDSQRGNLERKREDLKADLMQITNRIQTSTILLKQLENEALREGEGDEKITREVEEMKRELILKKGGVQRLEKEIEDKEGKMGNRGSEGGKQAELEEKKKELQKLDDDRSSVDHQIMRVESDLRNLG